MSDLIFLKLGGSLLTDKTGNEALRSDTLQRLAAEIAAARASDPHLQLVLGHGSGSFGHVAGARHGTRHGVSGAAQWAGFAEVADAAARLDRHVIAALLAAGVPAIGLPPSASALVNEGQIRELAAGPVEAALTAGVVPVVYGDVAFDTARGGTIVSTEEVMDYLAGRLHPTWLLLAGEMEGVLDSEGQIIPLITVATLPAFLPALGASRGTDVTGGMASKVTAMLDLVSVNPGLNIRIFSGLTPGLVNRMLLDPSLAAGTQLSSQ
jgi:isopentenyl phosphate kinase